MANLASKTGTVSFMKRLASLALAAVVTGCATFGSASITEPSSFVGVKVNETDKTTVFDKFGQPHDVFDMAGKNTWRYVYAKTSPEPFTFVLGVLIWPLVVIMQTQYDITQTEFVFDESGKLTDVQTRKGEKRKGLFALGEAFTDEQKAAIERVKNEMESHEFSYSEWLGKSSLAYLAI
jgi:outer membrane protein assembly factor BamE (lipoprotein component of BamABCDE complex)